MMKRIGLTIGKFAPFHKGHEYLIETALKYVNKLYVLIYETDVIEISIETRKKWIEEKFESKNIEVIEAKEPPKKYGMDKGSIKEQTDYILKLLKKNKIQGITHFFSSEEYGKYVAEVLKIENVLVDKKRIKVPINGTNIRKDLEKYKRYLSQKVYEDLRKYTE